VLCRGGTQIRQWLFDCHQFALQSWV